MVGFALLPVGNVALVVLEQVQVGAKIGHDLVLEGALHALLLEIFNDDIGFIVVVVLEGGLLLFILDRKLREVVDDGIRVIGFEDLVRLLADVDE